MMSRQAIAVWLSLPLLATHAAAQDNPPPAVNLPEVGKELSQAAGVSVVRQPFKFFGEAATSRLGGEGEPVTITLEGVGLKEAIEFMAVRAQGLRFFCTAKFPAGRYNVKVTAADERAAFAALAKVYAQNFDIKASIEKREMAALVLKETGAADARPLEKAPDEGGFSNAMTPRSIKLEKTTLNGFSRALESWLGQIVVNDVAREGYFRFELQVKTTRRKDVDAYLKEYGLVLVEERRAVEGAFVENAKPKGEEPPRD